MRLLHGHKPKGCVLLLALLPRAAPGAAPGSVGAGAGAGVAVEDRCRFFQVPACMTNTDLNSEWWNPEHQISPSRHGASSCLVVLTHPSPYMQNIEQS